MGSAVSEKQNGPEGKKERTRRRILDAARAVFAENGYEAANVSDIVGSIGMSQGTFYYHFTDKKSILMELLEDFFGRMRRLVADWARTTDVGPDVAARFARDVSMLLYENRELGHIILKESHSPDPDVRGLIKEFYEYLYEQTEKGLRLGMALGAVRELDARITAVALVGMIERVVLEIREGMDDMDGMDSMDGGGRVDIEHVMREIIELQNRGIRPYPDPRVEKA